MPLRIAAKGVVGERDRRKPNNGPVSPPSRWRNEPINEEIRRKQQACANQVNKSPGSEEVRLSC